MCVPIMFGIHVNHQKGLMYRMIIFMIQGCLLWNSFFHLYIIFNKYLYILYISQIIEVKNHEKLDIFNEFLD